MSTSRLADRDMDMEGQSDLRHEDGSEVLLRALKELLDRLGQARVGAPEPRAAEVAHWGDEEILYFETALPDSPGAEIDLNISGGKAFIRMVI
jgi:hypothetical protein